MKATSAAWPTLIAFIRGYIYSKLLVDEQEGGTMVVRHINRLQSKACPRSRKVGSRKYHDQPEPRTIDHQSELCSVLNQRAFIDRHEGIELVSDD